jgi:hypothetical protein
VIVCVQTGDVAQVDHVARLRAPQDHAMSRCHLSEDRYLYLTRRSRFGLQGIEEPRSPAGPVVNGAGVKRAPLFVYAAGKQMAGTGHKRTVTGSRSAYPLFDKSPA